MRPSLQTATPHRAQVFRTPEDLARLFPVKAVTALAEVGTLVAYLTPYLRNESISLEEVLSLALAGQVHF